MIIDENKKRNLVIAAVGDESLHRHWLPEVGYDVCLIYYGDQKGRFSGESKFYKERKGTKFHLVYEILPEMQDYDYVWMPDDDICLKPKYIRRLFSMAKKYNLSLCQPSIMGWYGLAVTLHHKKCLLRYTNYVEIMCPCFSRKALEKCMKTFKENNTGWGIDHVWNKILNNPTDEIAIIDDIIAIHTRPVGGGDMYEKQADGKMELAQNENYEIFKKYKMGESSYEDLKNGQIVSTESFGLQYHNTVEYGRIYKSNEAGVPVSKRLWPPSDEMKTLCQKIRGDENSNQNSLTAYGSAYGTHV
jgi:hypothetical protein